MVKMRPFRLVILAALKVRVVRGSGGGGESKSGAGAPRNSAVSPTTGISRETSGVRLVSLISFK